MIEIRRLRSGFFSVWVNGEWVNASLPTEKAAIDYAREFYPGKRIEIISA